jgi:hypothetical protein
MKLLLVMGSDKTHDILLNYLKLPGFEFIRYRHVQKAMDNIEEVDPAGIIISATDFPRHWKTLVSFVRSGRPKDSCPIVILIGDAFTEEEANKADALEVNCFVPESLKDPAKTKEIRALFAQAEHKKTLARFTFAFSNPADKIIITGTVKTVSASSLSFTPDHPALAENLEPGTKLQDCSFRAGTEILFPSCIVRKTGKAIDLDFLSFPRGEKEKLNNYLKLSGFTQPSS